MRAYQTEYQLFQSVERLVCQNEVSGRLFKSIDDFIKTAASIMNRRKARAGRSFENHVEYLLTHANIPHKMRPSLGEDGKPDIIIPEEQAYFDATFPKEKLFIVGLKTTCKDRWRQVLNEAPKHKAKHIVTLQQGISSAQLVENAQFRGVARGAEGAAQELPEGTHHQPAQRGELHSDGEAAAGRMTDVHTPEQRSRNMASIRGKDTKPEKESFAPCCISWATVTGFTARICRASRTLFFRRGERSSLCMAATGICMTAGGAGWSPRQIPTSGRTSRQGNCARDIKALDALAEAGWQTLVVWELRNQRPGAAEDTAEEVSG